MFVWYEQMLGMLSGKCSDKGIRQGRICPLKNWGKTVKEEQNSKKKALRSLKPRWHLRWPINDAQIYSEVANVKESIMLSLLINKFFAWATNSKTK